MSANLRFANCRSTARKTIKLVTATLRSCTAHTVRATLVILPPPGLDALFGVRE